MISCSQHDQVAMVSSFFFRFGPMKASGEWAREHFYGLLIHFILWYDDKFAISSSACAVSSSNILFVVIQLIKNTMTRCACCTQHNMLVCASILFFFFITFPPSLPLSLTRFIFYFSRILHFYSVNKLYSLLQLFLWFFFACAHTRQLKANISRD